MKDKIGSSYKQSKNIYDDLITQSKWWSKLYFKLFLENVDEKEIAKYLLGCIPDDFSGKFLDVPVGTAVFTCDKYKKLKDASITCLDYSSDMLEITKTRLRENDINNVEIVQGDVGALTFSDETFDIILCMNGIHVFPDKEKAYREMHRVLKKGGMLLASFYIQGESRRSDWFVKTILAKKGFVSPPFETISSLKLRMAEDYVVEEIHKMGAMVYFSAIKNN